MLSNQLAFEELQGKQIPCLDHGHIVLMDKMGSDSDIIQAARTCYQKGTQKASDDRTLIRYLMRHRHSSPFESCQIKLHIKLPIFVERQWARHRTAGWNEVSARYSELPEEFYIPKPEDICHQSKTNRQGRSEVVDPDLAADFRTDANYVCKEAFSTYHTFLEDDVSRELARIVLPLSTYTEKVWWINLHNLLHFCGLRSDSHAQKEIQVFSDVILHQIIKPLFPLVYEGFIDYRLEAMTLSRLDIEVIRQIMENTDLDEVLNDVFANKREREECVAKLKNLNLIWESEI